MACEARIPIERTLISSLFESRSCGHERCQAAALGVGALLPGDELDSSGTAEALVRSILPELGPTQLLDLARAGITTDLSIQPHRWSLLGGTEGGLAMRRVLDLLGVTDAGLAVASEPAACASRASGTASAQATCGGPWWRLPPPRPCAFITRCRLSPAHTIASSPRADGATARW